MMGAVQGEPEQREFNGYKFTAFTLDVQCKKWDSNSLAWVMGCDTFEVSVSDDNLVQAALSLKHGQGVQVAGVLESQKKSGQSGTYYNLRMRAKSIVPGRAPAAAASGSGAASPPQYSQGGYHAPAPQAQPQAQTPAPLPHEDEDDFPF